MVVDRRYGRRASESLASGGAQPQQLGQLRRGRLGRDPEVRQRRLSPSQGPPSPVEVVASGSVEAGARVDVVVTTDKRTQLAMQNVEVLRARPAAAKEDSGPRVTATLRVSAEDAVYLVAAQSFARDVRLLARAPGDTRTAAQLTVGDGL